MNKPIEEMCKALDTALLFLKIYVKTQHLRKISHTSTAEESRANEVDDQTSKKVVRFSDKVETQEYLRREEYPLHSVWLGKLELLRIRHRYALECAITKILNDKLRKLRRFSKKSVSFNHWVDVDTCLYNTAADDCRGDMWWSREEMSEFKKRSRFMRSLKKVIRYKFRVFRTRNDSESCDINLMDDKFKHSLNRVCRHKYQIYQKCSNTLCDI